MGTDEPESNGLVKNDQNSLSLRRGIHPFQWLDAYFRESERHPFFMLFEGQLAGFVLVREGGTAEDFDYQIAEFFVFRRFRRQGIGQRAARSALALFPGIWCIGFCEDNLPAVRFWRSFASGFRKMKLQPEPSREHRGRYLITIE